jgi:uncharacterized membrane protein (UPF0182 family)
MFEEFIEELRRRQAMRDGASEQSKDGSKNATGADDHQEPARSTEGPLEEDTVSSNGSGSDDTDREETQRPWSPFERGGGGSRRGSSGPSTEFPEFHLTKGWVVLGAILVGFVVLSSIFALTVGLITDGMWFNSIGFGDVFSTRVASQALFFVVGGLVAFVFLWFNLWLAGRFIPKGQLRRFSLDDFLDRFSVERYMGGESGPSQFSRPRARPVGGSSEAVQIPDLGRPAFWTLFGIGTLISLGMGAMANGGWDTIQLFLHRTPYGQSDPTFGLDISFFLFDLPFYRLIQSYGIGLLLAAIALVGVRYIVAAVSGASMPSSARVHIGLLVLLYLWAAAAGLQLDRYELVYSNSSGIFQGVGFTDANAQMLALNVLTVVSAFVGCFVLGFAYTRWRIPLVLTIFVWVAAFGILGVAYPQLVQRFSVVPNQQAQEAPYISNNIDMTRLGFNLKSWSGTTYTPGSTVSKAAVETESSTIQNVRLWDYRPLAKTLDGLQVVRQYYKFFDVDTDRYVFTDATSCVPSAAPCVRQVMLSGRELDATQLAQLTKGDQSWVNQHITYTHGYGLVMTPVNEVQPGGQPSLMIKDFPPASTPGAPKVTEPRIYFGTQSSNYVIVNAASQEFDYPSAACQGCDQYTTWSGKTGIKLDTPLSKLLFAARFGDLNMLISSQVTGSSQLLFNRSIQERTHTIAPFLRYDKDPYLIVTSSGRLAYVQDAFTTSANFPDANTYNPGTDTTVSGLAGGPFNYIRNSVKVVMDAYDGTMSFYVSDPNDPIIKAWSGVFPSLFKPIDQMPADIRGDATAPGHLRYPEDMFNAQTAQFTKYHVTDPSVFYQGNDVWRLPPTGDTDSGKGQTQLGLEAYYVQMRVPGQANPEFVLLQPMTLQGRQNMIAWVAAHNDPGKYGQVSVFDFPRNSNVFGPEQIESLIAQNRDISQQITLWGQVNSSVIMGNLLVIPLQDSLLYIQPVYLQAANNPLPVFQKVIVGTPTQIVWADNLQGALNQIYAGQGTTAPGGSAPPGATVTPGPSSAATPAASSTGSPTPLPSIVLSGTAQQLIAQADQHYQAAQAALRAGDLGTYQKEMDIVGTLLTQLQTVIGTPAPSTK